MGDKEETDMRGGGGQEGNTHEYVKGPAETYKAAPQGPADWVSVCPHMVLEIGKFMRKSRFLG